MDEKQDGRQAIIEANLSKSQPTSPQSSEGSSSTSTAEVIEEDEDQTIEEGQRNVDLLDQEDFLGDSKPESHLQAKSVTGYDVVRKHAVLVYNVLSNSAVPTAVRINHIQLVGTINDQWNEAATNETTMSKSFLDHSREFLFSFTGEEPESNVENNTNIKGAVNVGEPYNDMNSNESIDSYIQLIANDKEESHLWFIHS